MASVATAIMQPEESAIKAHLEMLFAPLRDEYPGGLVEICHGPAKPDRAAYFNLRTDGIADATAFAASRSRAGENVYVGVNPRKPGSHGLKRASDSDVELSIWHFADIDKASSLEGLGKKLRDLPPYYTADTGTTPHRRPHLYWLLDEPVWNLDAWTQRQRGIAHALGGDAVINPSRIMRLAGTVNFPPQHKVQRGYRVEVVTLKTEFDDERETVTPDEIGAAFPVAKGITTNDTPTVSTGETTLSAMRRTQVQDLIDACRSDHEWHNNMIRLVAHLAAIGRSTAEILAMADHITLPGYTAEQTATDMMKALQGARSKYGLEEPEEETVEEVEARSDLNLVDAFDFEETSIPVRPWLVPGAILAGYTHMLAAPGGSGKSLFTLQFAIALAAGIEWGGFTPRKRVKSLVINAEDDIDEQRRRLAAAARVMDVDPKSLRGWIFLIDDNEGVVVAGRDAVKRTIVTKPVVGKLKDLIKENGIGVLFADPFAETFEGDENDNSEVKWAMRIWRDEIARETGAAVYLVHHTTKYASHGAGDANVIRGAGAIVNSTRISATLMPMTEEEARVIGVEPEERNLYVRYDDAKANQSLLSGKAKWFEKRTVELHNATGLYEADSVGALVPWTPPGAFDGISREDIQMALERAGRGILDDEGLPSGSYFTFNNNGKDKSRWICTPIMEALGVEEVQAKKMVAAWRKSGVMVEEQYHDPRQRKERAGVMVDLKKAAEIGGTA